MNDHYYIGLDVHKKTITYVIKTHEGQLVRQGSVLATRPDLAAWAEAIERPWIGALEATMFSGWVYDELRPLARRLEVAHPLMLKAITCAKKKNDRLDADKICDLLRCNLLPRCYMAPAEIRELRRVLRYRNLLLREGVRMKNKVAGLLMEIGQPYVKEKLHRKKYFYPLLDQLPAEQHSVRELLAISRSRMELALRLERQLLRELEKHALLAERVKRLQTIQGVGPVLALTWALEVGEHSRFPSIGEAVSYCGLCGAQKDSAETKRRGPLSKQRNKHLQTMLIEAAKLAPRYNERLREVYQRERDRGPRNRATLEVARKLVAYLLAVGRRERDFEQLPPAA